MIELKPKRTAKDERFERDGNRCQIFSSILGGIGSAIGGGLLGLLGNKNQADRQGEAYDQYLRANENAGLPRWTDQQSPYVFGGQGWTPYMPSPSQEALDYGQAMAGGYNPAFGGPQAGPLGFNGILGQLTGVLPSTGQSGLQGILGYGQGVPPALYPGLLTGEDQQPPEPKPGDGSLEELLAKYNQWRGGAGLLAGAGNNTVGNYLEWQAGNIPAGLSSLNPGVGRGAGRLNNPIFGMD